jgi:protein phosphatase
VKSLDNLGLAPFHLLASEGCVHVDRDHVWHMDTLSLSRMCKCRSDPPFLLSTPWRKVDLSDAASEAEATAWWESLTESGGEGMVVKPLAFVHKGHRGLAQQGGTEPLSPTLRVAEPAGRGSANLCRPRRRCCHRLSHARGRPGVT